MATTDEQPATGDDDERLIAVEVTEFAAAGVDEEHPYGVLGEPVAERSPFRIAFVATLGVLLALLVGRAVWLVSSVIVLIVSAAFLAVGLNPAVEALQRRGMKRGLAAGTVMFAVLLFFLAFVAAAVPPVVSQAGALRDRIPTEVAKLRENNPTFQRLDKQFHIEEKVKSVAQTQGSKAPAAVLGLAKGVLTVIAKTLTVLILTLYFLGSYTRIRNGGLKLVPRSRRARVALLADEMLLRVGGYVLGNLATSLIAGVVCGIWFVAWDIPYALALAMLVAIFDLIPLVGATIAAIVCTAVAFFSGATTGIATGLFFVAYQQVENYILVPKVMKRTVDVSPLATVLAALVGGALLGVLGALLAVPTAAAISLVVREVVGPRQDAA